MSSNVPRHLIFLKVRPFTLGRISVDKPKWWSDQLVYPRRRRDWSSSEVGQGLADGEAGGAASRGFGGEDGAEEDDRGPDEDGGDRDPVRQRRGEEQVAKPRAEDRR